MIPTWLSPWASRRWLRRWAWSVLLGALVAGGPVAAEDAFVEGEALVVFVPGQNDVAVDRVLRRHATDTVRSFKEIAKRRGRWSGLVRGRGLSTARLIARLKADPAVETAEPNYYRRLSAAPPNDLQFPKLWGLHNTGQTVEGITGTSGVDIGFLRAWQLARPGAAEVVVAVVDSGLDITHPDLAANVWVNPGEIRGNGIDDDANGLIDDVNGYDFDGNTANVADASYHGTHVAGTVAGVGKNGLGVIGVNFRAKVLPLKVATDGYQFPVSAVIAAFDYAVMMKGRGVNIVAVNASFGGGSKTTAEENAVGALNSAGIILCAAAGNEGANNNTTPVYPAGYNKANVISVAALTSDNKLASFSNYGATTVDLAAPGTDIASTLPLALAVPSAYLTVAAVSYPAEYIEFSGMATGSGVSAKLYNCGLGYPGDFTVAVSGDIALIERGTLTFAEKVSNAMSAGAIAAIIYDDATQQGSDGWTLGAAGSWIPVIAVSRATGLTLRTKTLQTTVVKVLWDDASDYEFASGTSMATPHVAGAVAFAAQCFPTETVVQRVNRILNNVTPVTALAGKVLKGGRLNLARIVDTDNDGLPDWWESEYLTMLVSTGAADTDNDGASNEEEFLNGTDPGDGSSRFVPVISQSVGGGGGGSTVTVNFPGLAGRLYQVEWNATLDPGTWMLLGSPVSGFNGTIHVPDPGLSASATERFYRVLIGAE